MIRGNTPWHPLPNASISWKDNSSPYSTDFGDYYYSSEEGRRESQYVFLRGNQIPQRCSSHPRASFCIVETGFGTGLNFLLTWEAWLSQPSPRPHLHFISLEKYPLAKDDMVKALRSWPDLEPLATQLLAHYPQPLPGQHRLVLDEGRVTLDLWWEDAEDALCELASYGKRTVDAWYLDGFSPNRNEEMWTDKIVQCMASISRTNATFATFTAAGNVRRTLARHGFQVVKSPGFGKKRECVHGSFTGLAINSSPTQGMRDTPWDIPHEHPSPPSSVLIVGAGIAGCTAAQALARRNINVCILDSGPVANAGSGNDQGVLYTRLSHKHSPLNDFSLQSYGYALRFYQQLFSTGALQEGIDGALCGSFHQSDKLEEMHTLATLLQPVPDLARVLSAPEANDALGVVQKKAGYWFPGSGWIRPASVCHALLQHPNIQLFENTGTLRLKPTPNGWVALSGTDVIAEAECAVIAAGTMSGKLHDLGWLPLQAIRGQTSTLPASRHTGTLRAALCHSGYIPPARDGVHCIGATFDIKDQDDQLRATDHRKNLEALGAAVPDWREQLTKRDEQTMAGRVGYRCASPDYLPLVGPVPKRAVFLQTYAALRKNARQTIPGAGECIPGLYLSTGHGSRGLTSTPLAGEILASLMCGEAVPLSRELNKAISPARFIIRDLKRKKA